VELNTYANPELCFFFQCFLYLISDSWPGESVDCDYIWNHPCYCLASSPSSHEPHGTLKSHFFDHQFSPKNNCNFKGPKLASRNFQTNSFLSLKDAKPKLLNLCRTDVKALGQPYLEGGMSNEGEVSCSFIRCWFIERGIRIPFRCAATSRIYFGFILILF